MTGQSVNHDTGQADRFASETKRMPRFHYWLLKVVLLAFAYWGAAFAGDHLGTTEERISLIWPPLGVGIAGMLIFGTNIWPGVFLGSLLNNFVVNGWPSVSVLLVASGSALAAVFASYSLRRMYSGAPVMIRVRDVIGFFYIAGVVSTLISAAVGVWALSLGGIITSDDWMNKFFTWWMADSLGAVLVGSLLMTWLYERPTFESNPRAWKELAALSTTIAIIGIASIWRLTPQEFVKPASFLAFPAVIWAALVYGQHGATLATFAISAFLMAGALEGEGPFVGGTATHNHMALASFVMAMSMTSMIVAAASRERRMAFSDRIESEQRYRDLADAMFMGVMIHDGTHVLEVNAALTRMLGCKSDEIIGRSPFDFFAVRTDLQDNALINPAETLPIETFAHRKNGTLITVEIIGRMTSFRGETARVILVRDLSERTDSEREIARLNSFYAKVFDEMPSEMAVFDPMGRYLFVNAAAVRDPEMREWLIGKTNFDYCKHRGRDIRIAERRQEMFDKVLRMKQTVRFEESIETPYGDKKHYIRCSSPVLNPKGEVTHVLGYGIDITELKRAQTELDRIHTSLRCLVWYGPVDVHEGQYKWRTRLMDDEAAQRFLPLDVEPGSDFLGALAKARMAFPEDSDRTHAAFTVALERNDPHYQAEYRVRLKNGIIRWLAEDVFIERLRPNLLQVFGITTDVTALKQSEEALRLTVGMYRNVVETAHDVVWSIDRDGRITFVNQAAKNVFGEEPEQMLGRRIFEFLGPDEISIAESALGQLLTGQTVRFLTIQFIRVDGITGTLNINAVPIRDESGEITGAAGTAADVTELHKAEQERERLEIQIRHAQKLESLGVLAGGIAHDFNNLLVGILGHAGLAIMDLPNESTVLENVKQIEKAALRAADLTNQMLAYAGKGKFVITPIDLTQLVLDMVHLLEVTISKKAVLKWELAENMPAVEGDATQLNQVIMNLIINASDALNDKPGVVVVRTGVVDATSEYLSKAYIRDGVEPGTFAFVEVADTGAGMDETTTSRIFEPFFTTKFTGRGLGLAAALGIVRAHHGTLHIESEPEKGSTFRVLLPCSKKKPEQRKEPSIAPGKTVKTHKIMVVDDEDLVRNVICEILQHYGFSVVTASDGLDAVEKFKKQGPEIDAVVLDMLMPVMDGVETLSQLRELRKDVPVILSSGYSEQEATQHVRFDRLNMFIQKPYQPATLVEMIQTAIQE